MHRARRVTKQLSAHKRSYDYLLKRGYSVPTASSRRHKEPQNLSWQWSVRKETDLAKCRDLCLSKICPKKSFFPRFKKAYVPKEKVSCVPPKKKQTWKEFFSYILPDPVPKPPLITCRKLMAERRRACGNPYKCPGYCLNDNCCPPPQEWFGQAVIYSIPSPFPEPAPIKEVVTCLPPPPKEPICRTNECPPPPEVLDMDAYAYKKAFSNINTCDEYELQPRPFKCKNPCYKEAHELSQKLSCGLKSEFKNVTCPTVIQKDSQRSDLPILVCKKSHCKVKSLPKKVVKVEVKKGICGRTTFLKPHKYTEKYPGMPDSKNMHTDAHMAKSSTLILKANYSTDQNEKKPSIMEPTEAQLVNSTWLNYESPAFVKKMSYYQPGSSGAGTNSLLSQRVSGSLNSEAAYSPYHETTWTNEAKDDDGQDIDPELLKIAAESKKYLKYASKEKNSEPPVTVVRMLSNEVTKRLIEEAKQKGETLPVMKRADQTAGLSKLSLLRPKTPMENSRATYTTSTPDFARKKKPSSSKKKDIICAGCIGIRQAEEEERNPPPKSFLDCKIRPPGKCRGPTRKLAPGEPEPDNPYMRHKAKPYSMCNKPRPVEKKEERGYALPCEKNPKRKFHTSLMRSESAPEFVSLYEMMKSKGTLKCLSGQHLRTNDWDSHTSESYNEKENFPIDLKKMKSEDFRIPDGYSSANSLTNQTNNAIPAKTNDDWDCPSEPYEDKRLMRSSLSQKTRETKKARSDSNQESARSGIKPIESTINLWDSQNSATKNGFPTEQITVDSNDKEQSTDYNTKQFGSHGTEYFKFSERNQFSSTKTTKSKPTKFNVLFDSMNRNKSAGGNMARDAKVGDRIRGGRPSFVNPLEE